MEYSVILLRYILSIQQKTEPAFTKQVGIIQAMMARNEMLKLCRTAVIIRKGGIRMKKCMTFLGGVIVLLCGLMLVINLGLFDSETVLLHNLYFSYNKIGGSCEVSHGIWPGEEEVLVAEIPDEVNGRRVTAMGDSYPDPFLLNFEEGIAYVCGEEMLPEDAVIIPRYLTIEIGKNLRVLGDIEMKYYYCDADDPKLFYRILVTVECSEKNRNFYSENGKLYIKAGDRLVDVFFYASDYK